MAEPTYREIQLSLKQLVFLFMSAVVVAVVIFLLGVSVGRGVDGAQGAAADADGGAPTDTLVSTQPPPTEPAPGELTYHQDLQGGARGGQAPDPGGADPAAADPVTADPVPALPDAPPPPEPDPVTPPPAQPPPQPAAGTASAGRGATPPATQTRRPASQATAPPETRANAEAEGAFALQLGAFGARDNADRLVAELAQKGYTAYVARPASSSLFAVRIGPFETRAQAESMSQRLSRDPKRYQSLIIR